MIGDPANGNRYTYTGDDPINNIDPSGMCDGFFGCAAAVAGHVLIVATEAVSCYVFGSLGFALGGAVGFSAGGPFGSAIGGTLGFAGGCATGIAFVQARSPNPRLY